MDIKEKIQLGRFQNLNSENLDNSVHIQLEKSNDIITEYGLNSTVDSTDIFDIERQQTDIYRLHGQLQYFSITNNLRDDYETANDFFIRPFIGDGLSRKNITTDFKFYIVKPIPPSGTILGNGNISNGYVETNINNRYFRNFEIIATPDQFDFYNAGFAKNIFNEQQFAFNVATDIDLSNAVDGLNFPISEVFLYAIYRPSRNGRGQQEQIREKNYNNNGDDSGWELFKNNISDFNKGDVVLGDVVSLNKEKYSQTQYNEMEYQVKIPYDLGELRFQYKPFIPIKVRVMSNDLQRVSLESTDFERKNEIPSHALDLGGGDFVWKNLLDKGFIDPLTNEGVNYPFINKRHYIFINDVMSFSSVENINTLLDETIYGNNDLIQNEPQNLNQLGQKC